VDKKAWDASQTELLVRRFGQCGATVSDAVPAFAGVYPAFRWLGNSEWLFVRWRVLALAAGEVQVWTAWTGPTPKKLLVSCDRHDLVVERSHLAFSRVTVAERRLWVHKRHLTSLEGWHGSADRQPGHRHGRGSRQSRADVRRILHNGEGLVPPTF
jgi:hypothetical protein